MTTPAITLLIPCYNAAGFLPRLMESVRQSTRPFAAVLCYDDGSTDHTVEIAESLGLTILRGGANAGVSAARNRLVSAAATEWIHFHDADDLIGPQFVERLGAKCSGEVDVVSCDADWVEDASRALVIAWRYDAAALASHPCAHLLERPMGLNSSVIRRTRWAAVGGCDESLGMWEDADIHIRMAAAGARFVHVPEVHTWSLRRDSSFSHDYRKSWNFRLRALERYARELPPHCSGALVDAIETAAMALLRHGDHPAAQRAIQLGRQLGVRLPRSSQPLIAGCRTLLGPMTALRLQSWVRNRKQA